MEIIKFRPDLTNRQLVDTLTLINSEYLKVRKTITEETLPLAQSLLNCKRVIINILESRNVKEIAQEN